MVKLGKGHAGAIAAVGVVVLAAVLLKETALPSVYGVCTLGFNYSHTGIDWFGVKTPEGACGNAADGAPSGDVYGGGGVACGCSVRPGEQATIKWRFGQSYDEVQRGVPARTFQTTVTIPKPESRSARYLQVHFLSDNRVTLDWRDDSFSRVDPVTGKILNIHGGEIGARTGKFVPFITGN